ncbi:MAG: ABC transporter permease [Eubacterium sp.]|nr:ABC transporter permease [Eubacterium sp.]
MYKLYFIAKNNMKKQKGDMITFFILTFMATFLIFECLSTILGMGRIFDERYDEVNGVDIMLLTGDSEEENECAEKAFKDDEHITGYERTDNYSMQGEYRKKGDEDYSQYSFFMESYDEEPEYMNMRIDQDKLSKNDILIPLYLKTTYQVGDTMQIKLDKDVYDFNVAGYAENPYFCSSVNITVYYVYMSQEIIDELIEDHPGIITERSLHKGKADDTDFTLSYTTADLEHDITETYKKLIKPYSAEHPEKSYFNYMAVNRQWMKGGSEFLPMILIAIVLLFAILIFIIAIVIISFSIKNFIQRNMKNTGILEASGYTVKELRNALTVQILVVAGLGSIAGVILGVLSMDSFGDIVSMVSGMSWNQPTNVFAIVITILGILLTVFLVARSISRTYNRITVLDALRGGINTHNFKKNFFSFEKTPLPISVVLSLKDTFGAAGRNIVIILITVVLTISALVSFGIYENFGRDGDALIDFMAMELGEVALQGDTEMGDDLRKLEGADVVLGYYGIEPTVYHGDEKETIYTYVYDDAKNAIKTRVVEGRLPEHDNEIMITGASAGDIDAKLGDVVELEIGDTKEDYLIVGINQRVERTGRSIIMNMDAANRIVQQTPVLTYIINTEDGVSFDTMRERIEDYAEENDIDIESLGITNSAKLMASTTDSVTGAMKVLCVVIAFLTAVIVIFVESLIIRAKITREWRGMGISKALGMTSGGLISQIILSNAPAIITGLLIGILLSQPAGSGLTLIVFSIFGMKSMDYKLPFIWIAITAVVILASAVFTSGILGMKVKTLKPVEMITEE